MTVEYETWRKGELEDQSEPSSTEDVTSPITSKVDSKSEEEKTNDEKWDVHLSSTVNSIESWRREKTGIGPEPELLPSEETGTAEGSMYVDDNSAGEEATTLAELKEKTEIMLKRIFDHMWSNRLLVNSGKTRVMLMATYQKRSKNDLSFEVNIEGAVVKEVESARLLGVEISNNFSWEKHVEETTKECSKRLSCLYKINREISKEQKKVIVEGAIVSRLRYAIEVIFSGSDSVLNRLGSVQS